MKQKFSVVIADVPMSVVSEESADTIGAVVASLDEDIRAIVSASGCTRTEAVLLVALDRAAKVQKLEARIAELDAFLDKADPAGDNFEASLLRGENETLRAEIAVKEGKSAAFVEDNKILHRLNAKLAGQTAEANARADRMHDQVIAILAEVRELREKLAMFVETKEPSAAYLSEEPAPRVEIDEDELAVTEKYLRLDAGTALGGAGTP